MPVKADVAGLREEAGKSVPLLKGESFVSSIRFNEHDQVRQTASEIEVRG